MFIYREGEQVIQRAALVQTFVDGLSQGGWISERKMKRKEKSAQAKPGMRVKIDNSGGLTQSVEFVED